MCLIKHKDSFASFCWLLKDRDQTLAKIFKLHVKVMTPFFLSRVEKYNSEFDVTILTIVNNYTQLVSAHIIVNLSVS